MTPRPLRTTDLPVEIPLGLLLEPPPSPAPGPEDPDPRSLDPLDLLSAGVLAIDTPQTSDAVRRGLGRAMAHPAHDMGVGSMLHAFAALHVGTLRLTAATPDRYVFESSDLRSADTPQRTPTCHLALGFVEGLVEASAGGTALGAEVSCRARGDKVCRFVVRSQSG